MAPSSVYMFIVFGVLGVLGEQSTDLVILGRDYEMEVVKVYWTNAPSFMEFTSPFLKLAIVIDGKGYDVGAHFQNVQMVPLPNYKPIINDTFIDQFGNILECKNGQATFVVRKERYQISTGESKYVLQCFLDYERNRAFIISGNIQEKTKGKLYVFDTKKPNKTINGIVLTQEIEEVGADITAGAVRPSNAVIVLSKELIVYNLTHFNMILLTPITAFKAETVIGSKLTSEQITKLDEFKGLARQIQNKLTELLEQNFQNLIDYIYRDNMIVRQMTETMYRLHTYNLSELPEKGSMLTSLLEDVLKSTIKQMSDESVRIYNKNVLGNKTQREIGNEIRCERHLNTLQTLISYYIKRVIRDEESRTAEGSAEIETTTELATTVTPIQNTITTVSSVDGNELKNFVERKINKILKIHDDNWRGCAANLGQEYINLGKVLQKRVGEPYKNMSSILVSEKYTIFEGSCFIQNELEAAVHKLTNELIELYNKRLLELDVNTLRHIRKARLCAWTLFKTKKSIFETGGPAQTTTTPLPWLPWCRLPEEYHSPFYPREKICVSRPTTPASTAFPPYIIPFSYPIFPPP